MPPMDFEELAASMTAGLDGVRACLIVSRDGLSLGASPAGAEATARRVWDKLQEIGDPQRGFVDVGTEIWVMARRGKYAAVAVAGPEAKPGRVLDRIETQLAVAEKVIGSLDADEPRDERAQPPRSPMHPEPRLAQEPEPAHLVEQVVGASYEHVLRLEPRAEAPAASTEAPAEPPAPRAPVHDVDRVALAREFGRLLEREENA